jgi:dihydroflavonol-4-reductase
VSRRSKKAVVIGASGHLGNSIVRALLEKSYQVRACGRRTLPPANLRDLSVQYEAGDSETPGQFDRWIAGNDLVIDAAAPYPLDVFSPLSDGAKDAIANAEQRTRRLLIAVSHYDARLVYVSSFVTLVRPGTSVQRIEHQMMRLAHPYFEVKQLIESRMIDASRNGTPIVIANPTYCLGPWDLRDRRLCTIPLLLRGEIPSSIDQLLNVIDVRDVAAAVIAALDAERYGEPILMDGHNISTQQLYSMICEVGGAPHPRFSTRSTVALIGAYAIELMLGAIGERTRLPSGGIMMASLFDYIARGQQLKELGITPRPLSETILDAIRWYRQISYC